jgi:hypothetical protein
MPMKIESFLKLGTAAIALIGFAATFVGQFLPGKFKESEYGLQLFVLREFRLELLTLGVAGLLIYVFWEPVSKVGAAWLRRLGTLLAAPRGLYGPYARRAAAVGIVLTAAVAAGGFSYAGYKFVRVAKVNYVYLRDRVAIKYHRFLWREARLAQASFDYAKAVRILEHVAQTFPEDTLAKKEAKFVNHVIDAANRLDALGRESLGRYGINPTGVALLAEALALNPGAAELRSRLHDALAEIDDAWEAADRATLFCGDRRGAGAAQVRLSRRAMQYLVDYGDRAALSGREAQQRLLASLCDAGSEEGGPNLLDLQVQRWRTEEIDALLFETSSENLAARARDYELAWSIADREQAGRTVLVRDTPQRAVKLAARR